MSYVVYDKRNQNVIVLKPKRSNYYKTMASAQAAVTRASKKYQRTAGTEYRPGRKYEDYRMDKDPQFTYGIAEFGYYQDNLEKFVERKNMMDGTVYMESVNTPNYMSPSSEAYWSM